MILSLNFRCDPLCLDVYLFFFFFIYIVKAFGYLLKDFQQFHCFVYLLSLFKVIVKCDLVSQVAFRAKVGKRNQLPHKGIIPEEFGVVSVYLIITIFGLILMN